MDSRWGNGLVAAGILLAIAAAFGGIYLSILIVGVSVITLFLISIRNRPNAILVLWILCVAMVPPWISFQLLGYRLPVAAVVSIGVVLTLIGRKRVKWQWCDTAILCLVLMSVVATAAFSSPLHLTTQVLFEWVACYAAGRFMFAGADFPRVASVVGGLIGWLALIQLILSFNLADYFIFNFGISDAPWMNLQERGGQIRSELTFGHSISLGATLSLLLPFALKSGKNISNRLMVAGIILGIISTSSRSAMISGAIVLVIYLIASNVSGVMKVAGSIGMGLATWVGTSIFLERISGAENSAELTDSTAYREGLLDLIGQVKLLGLSPGGTLAQDGVTYIWSSFYSIDNGILYIGLYLGWISVACYLVGIIYVAWFGFRGPARPFSIALIAQVPVILTVAPITQYQNYFWMIIGAGVSAVVSQRTSLTPLADAQSAGLQNEQSTLHLSDPDSGRNEIARI